MDPNDKIKVINANKVTQSEEEEDDDSRIKDVTHVEPSATPECIINNSAEDAHMWDADEVMSVGVEDIVLAATDTIAWEKDENILEANSEGAVVGLMEVTSEMLGTKWV